MVVISCADDNQNSRRFPKFRSEFKRKSPFRFLLTGIFGITLGGGPLISVGNIPTEIHRSIIDNFRRSNFCTDNRDKTEVPDLLLVEDLISYKLNNRRKNIFLYCVISLANIRPLLTTRFFALIREFGKGNKNGKTEPFRFQSGPSVSNIPQCAELSILGVTFQQNCKYSSHVRAKVTKANKSLFVLGSLRKEGMSQEEVDHLFNAIVSPNFSCASDSDLSVIQKFLDRCMKRKFTSKNVNIKDLLEKADKTLYKKRSNDPECPFFQFLPKEKNTRYNLRDTSNLH